MSASEKRASFESWQATSYDSKGFMETATLTCIDGKVSTNRISLGCGHVTIPLAVLESGGTCTVCPQYLKEAST